MIKKIKSYLIILASVAALAAPAFVPAVASADPNIQGSLCHGTTNLQLSNSGSGTCDTSGTTDTFNSIIKKVVNIFSVVVGIIAVVMIIVGGFKYITSGGESNNVSSAKNTILFAIVGLIIVALAQVIVHFVIAQGTNITS